MTSPTPTSGVPLDQPAYGASLPESVRRFFKKYTAFEGRASRSEYWWMMLTEVLVFVVLFGLHFLLLYLATGDGPVAGEDAPWLFILPILMLVWILATIIPWMSISWRRLHDAGYPGWLFLLSGLPVMNIVFFIFTLMPASPSGDQYNVGAAARPQGGQPLQPGNPQALPAQDAAPYAGPEPGSAAHPEPRPPQDRPDAP